ncbi:hypothetical protein D9M70_582040 [compost metagenome]
MAGRDIATADLAVRLTRNRIDLQDLHRQLMPGEMAAAPFAHGLRRHRHLGAEEQRDALPGKTVALAEGDRIGDRGHGHDGILHVLRVDVEAGDIDHVVQTRDEDQHAVGTAIAEIARVDWRAIAIPDDNLSGVFDTAARFCEKMR